MPTATTLSASIAKPEGAGSLGYVCAFESVTAQFSGDSLKLHDGLEAIQTVRAKDGKCLHIAFWRSREHHDLAAPRLLEGAGAQVIFDGPAAPLVSRVRWYKRVRLSTWLLSSMAIIGALEFLSNRYEKVFTAPNALVKLDQQNYKFVQGSRLAGSVTVENLLAAADLRDVDVKVSLVPPVPDTVPVVLDGVKPSIPAAKDRLFHFDIKPIPPGEYELRIEVMARGGYLRFWPHSFLQTGTVRVFPLTPRGKVYPKSPTPLSTELLALIPTGVALKETAVCEISFEPGPEFRFERTYTADPAVFESNVGPDGLMRSVLSWKPGALPAKEVIRREFRLLASKPVDWAKVADSAKIGCSRE